MTPEDDDALLARLALPAGGQDDDALLSKLATKPATKPATMRAPQGSEYEVELIPDFIRGLARTVRFPVEPSLKLNGMDVLEGIPAAMGGLYGMAGGPTPASVPFAALGRSSGVGYRDLIKKALGMATTAPANAPKELAVEAAKGALDQATGLGMEKGLKYIADGLFPKFFTREDYLAAGDKKGAMIRELGGSLDESNPMARQKDPAGYGLGAGTFKKRYDARYWANIEQKANEILARSGQPPLPKSLGKGDFLRELEKRYGNLTGDSEQALRRLSKEAVDRDIEGYLGGPDFSNTGMTVPFKRGDFSTSDTGLKVQNALNSARERAKAKVGSQFESAESAIGEDTMLSNAAAIDELMKLDESPVRDQAIAMLRVRKAAETGAEAGAEAASVPRRNSLAVSQQMRNGVAQNVADAEARFTAAKANYERALREGVRVDEAKLARQKAGKALDRARAIADNIEKVAEITPDDMAWVDAIDAAQTSSGSRAAMKGDDVGALFRSNASDAARKEAGLGSKRVANPNKRFESGLEAVRDANGTGYAGSYAEDVAADDAAAQAVEAGRTGARTVYTDAATERGVGGGVNYRDEAVYKHGFDLDRLLALHTKARNGAKLTAQELADYADAVQRSKGMNLGRGSTESYTFDDFAEEMARKADAGEVPSVPDAATGAAASDDGKGMIPFKQFRSASKDLGNALKRRPNPTGERYDQGLKRAARVRTQAALIEEVRKVDPAAAAALEQASGAYRQYIQTHQNPAVERVVGATVPANILRGLNGQDAETVSRLLAAAPEVKPTLAEGVLHGRLLAGGPENLYSNLFGSEKTLPKWDRKTLRSIFGDDMTDRLYRFAQAQEDALTRGVAPPNADTDLETLIQIVRGITPPSTNLLPRVATTGILSNAVDPVAAGLMETHGIGKTASVYGRPWVRTARNIGMTGAKLSRMTPAMIDAALAVNKAEAERKRKGKQK